MKSKEFILNLINDKSYIPQSLDNLAKFMNADKYSKKALKEVIKELEKENKLRISSKGKIIPISEEEASLVGSIQLANGGYGFFISDNKGFSDVFIAKDSLLDARNKDRVRIKIIKEESPDKKAEGEVVEIVERNDENIVGTYQENKNFGFVVADDKRLSDDIYINKKYRKNAKNNDKVLVKIINYPKDGSPEGMILEVIGNINDKNIDVLSLIRQHGVETEFSKKTKKEVLYIPEALDKKEKKDRKDFTDLFTVTIDGRDSKDFDDAISIEKNGDNFDLYVHIADIANYVKKGSSLDSDAYERGNSTYLYNIVLPMLPEKLSNGICSLNPNEERLCLSVRMTIDKKGDVIDNEFFESVIKSDYRLVYDDVNSLIDDGVNPFDDEFLIEKIKCFNELSLILKKKREKKGAIDFDFTESQIDVTDDGGVLNIEPFERGSGNKMIEEFMLAANETVANLFAYMDFPFIYRIHEEPSDEKLETFKRVLEGIGITLRKKEVRPKDFQIILKEVKGKDFENLVNTFMLRSMQKAKYSERRYMHFGLSTENYTHFTSPIRRYPDLIVHRLLKQFMHNKLNNINQASLSDSLEKNAEHLSLTERKSEELERDVEDLMKCKYMKKFLGQEFVGRISSITEFGMFVELDNTVEGLFMYKFSDDRYDFLEESLECINVNKNKRYRFGQEVKIYVMNVDLELRNIDFNLVEDYEDISE